MNALFATTARGLEYLLQDELAQLGIAESRQTPGGVHFEASLEQAYRVCLWSRLASRVLMSLDSFSLKQAEDLYQAVSQIDWPQIFDSQSTLAIDFVGTNGVIRHSQFGAQTVKDAICDVFRDSGFERPSVDKHQPDIRLNLHLSGETARLYLDLSGDSLHRRGYRLQQGQAPLKETLAAAMLLRANWPQLAKEDGWLVDPFCGSGTLLIEGAMMAADIAPGLLRPRFGFEAWLNHDQQLWQVLKDEAWQRKQLGLENLKPVYFGFDQDAHMLNLARANAERAGLAEHLEFAQLQIGLDSYSGFGSQTGLLITNPPYGERLNAGQKQHLQDLYFALGATVKRDFPGWKLAVLTPEQQLARQLRLRSTKDYQLFNGPIECRLYCYQLLNESRIVQPEYPLEQAHKPEILSPQAEDFENRLRKNLKSIQKWAQQQQLEAYRIYDADLPDYAVAIDIYRDHLLLQEYQAPAEIPARKTEQRLREALYITSQVTGIEAPKIAVKVRSRQKGKDQYQKQQEGDYFPIEEYGARYWVNLTQYLDTGVFLDHRLVRKQLRELSAGKKVLNLFCYTGTASVQAALGGGQVTSVDLSNTYLNWAEQNFELNDIDWKGQGHQFIQADCLQWLKQCEDRFDLIFMDPPTFSNSKRMDEILDIQRDHRQLIEDSLALLKPDGVLIFSNNYRRFKLDPELSRIAQIEDISQSSLPKDFARNPRIRGCWRLKPKC